MSNKSDTVQKRLSEAQKSQEELSKKREQELIPVAREVLKIIANGNIPIGSPREDDDKKLHEATSETLGVLLENNVRYLDKEFLFQLVKQAVEGLQHGVSHALGRSLDTAIDASLGKKFDEIRLKDLDDIIKASVKAKQAQSKIGKA